MSDDLAKPFVWTTQEGKQYRPAEMETRHLFYSLRMVFNHTVPPPYQIPGCKHYAGPEAWPIAYRRAAVLALVAELSRRDLAPYMKAQILYMAGVCGQLCLEQLRRN